MVSSGLWTLLIALLCPAMGITNRVFTGGLIQNWAQQDELTISPISAPYSMEFQDWLLVFGTSVASIIATLLVIPASRMATPTIVNMVRSTELLFAYAVEFALYGTVPEPLVAVGAALGGNSQKKNCLENCLEIQF